MTRYLDKLADDRRKTISSWTATRSRTFSALLDESLSEYKALTEIATAAYRHATDLGDDYKWTTVRDAFAAEAAFHSQGNIAAVVGPISSTSTRTDP